MFYIAICDDEQYMVEQLASYLSEIRSPKLPLESIPFFNGWDLVHQYEQQRRFDIIILDMMMKPLNGIETAKLIRAYDSEVPIFIVTATPEYAMDGYKVNAHRYILKPLDKAYFQSEVKNVLTSLARKQTKYFSFTNERGLSKVKMADIYYFESIMRTMSICYKGNKVDFTGKISDLEEALADKGFVRIHKSYLVNLEYVRNIFKETVTLENGEELPLSRHKSKALREQFLQYLKDSV